MIREQWDFPLLEAMSAYWTNHPPVHLLMAAHVGFKPEPEKAADISELLANFDMRPT